MAKAILGRKLGMTQIFTEEGRVVPVTVVESGNNLVLRNKTNETDGYNAVQIGFGDVKEKNVTKPLKGQFEKAGVKAVRFIRHLEGQRFCRRHQAPQLCTRPHGTRLEVAP